MIVPLPPAVAVSGYPDVDLSPWTRWKARQGWRGGQTRVGGGGPVILFACRVPHPLRSPAPTQRCSTQSMTVAGLPFLSAITPTVPAGHGVCLDGLWRGPVRVHRPLALLRLQRHQHDRSCLQHSSQQLQSFGWRGCSDQCHWHPPRVPRDPGSLQQSRHVCPESPRLPGHKPRLHRCLQVRD